MQEWHSIRYIKSLWNRQDLRAPLVAAAANDEEAVALLPVSPPERVEDFLLQLPKEVLQQLFKYLTLDDIFSLRQTCRKFRYTYNNFFRVIYFQQKNLRAVRWAVASRHSVETCPLSQDYTEEMRAVMRHCLDVLVNPELTGARKRQAIKKIYLSLMRLQQWFALQQPPANWEIALNMIREHYSLPRRSLQEIFTVIAGVFSPAAVDNFDHHRIHFRTLLHAVSGCLEITRGNDTQPFINVAQLNEDEKQQLYVLKKIRRNLLMYGGAACSISSAILFAELQIMLYGMPQNEALQFLIQIMFLIPGPLLYAVYGVSGIAWTASLFMGLEQYHPHASMITNYWRTYSDDNRREDEALARLDVQPVQEPVLSSARQFFYRNYNAVRNWFFPHVPVQVADIENQLDHVEREQNEFTN